MQTTTELAALLNKSAETIRRWVEEFKPYLSSNANPSTGSQRRFSDDDVRILTLVYAMKEQGKVYDEIHAALKNGERGELISRTKQIAPQESSQLALQSQIDKLQTDLEQERALRHDAEGQIKQLEKQIDKLLDRLFNREE